MRNSFAAEILALAGEDPRIVLLSGDIGNRLFDSYKERFADRFLNCGVAEANLISMAAGMALSGLRPVAYTIASFITTRCLEQIRLDVRYHETPVVIVGVGAGLSYASLGVSHQSCEDIAFLRTLPGMIVLCPGDPMEVRCALRAALQQERPAYIRIGKKGERTVHRKLPDFHIGRGIVVSEGEDACLLATGNVLPLAVDAAAELRKQGVSAGVVSLHTVKPLDERLLEHAFSRFKLVISIEEHSVVGGLGSAIAEWLADRPPHAARLLRIGTPDVFLHEGGGAEHFRQRFGLTASAIAGSVLREGLGVTS